ncbi:MAG: reverse transcriptase domain-containing protein [Acidobacteriota bacterium]
MQTSLQAIANKAARDKRYRFSNLYRMLNVENTIDSWRLLNKRAATGVDQISAQEFGENLQENVETLIAQVRGNRYRAKLVRRQYIPKANGKLRPLGIPATADKLLQKVVTRILDAIYKQDFLPSSYGYRPNIGPQDAVRDLSRELQFGPYNFLVEADIRGYFDNLDHSLSMRAVKKHRNVEWILLYIERWLKAPVQQEDGTLVGRECGMPQGSVISPLIVTFRRGGGKLAQVLSDYLGQRFLDFLFDLISFSGTGDCYFKTDLNSW